MENKSEEEVKEDFKKETDDLFTLAIIYFIDNTA